MSELRNVWIFAGCAALNSCNLGYDLGINSVVGPPLLEDFGLNSVELELFIAALDFFSIFGALATGKISDFLGRRKAFAVAACTFLSGTVFLTVSTSYLMLMGGRCLLGLGIGFGLAADPVYISEITPREHRGRLVSLSEIGINVGLVLGFLTGAALSWMPGHVRWRWMFAAGGVLPCVMLLLVRFVMVESPRWLVLKDRADEAITVMELLYPKGTDVASMVDDIKVDIAQECALNEKVRWRDLFCPAPAVKEMLIVGVGIAGCQQLCGIDILQYFMLFILEDAGIESESSQIAFLVALGFVKLSLVIVAGPLFDRSGRRPLLLASCAGMSVSLLVMAINAWFLNVAWLTLVALVAFLSSFSFGMGPGAWLIPSEVFGNHVRAKGMALATVANRIVGSGMAAIALSLSEALTWGGCYFLLTCVVVGIFLFIYWRVPETQGMSLEEVTAYFVEIANDRSSLLHTPALEPESGRQVPLNDLPTPVGKPSDLAWDGVGRPT